MYFTIYFCYLFLFDYFFCTTLMRFDLTTVREYSGSCPTNISLGLKQSNNISFLLKIMIKIYVIVKSFSRYLQTENEQNCNKKRSLQVKKTNQRQSYVTPFHKDVQMIAFFLETITVYESYTNFLSKKL